METKLEVANGPWSQMVGCACGRPILSGDTEAIAPGGLHRMTATANNMEVED